MPTINQLSLGMRKPKKKRCRLTRWLMGCPQKKATIVKLKTMTPRKPNSAIRKIAKVKITSTRKKVQAFITGKGHNLQAHSTVMLRGGRANDLPGIHYKMIRGKYDFLAKEDFLRTSRRSKFSLKKPPETKTKALREKKLLYAASKGLERLNQRRAKNEKENSILAANVNAGQQASINLMKRLDHYYSMHGTIEGNLLKERESYRRMKNNQYIIPNVLSIINK